MVTSVFNQDRTTSLRALLEAGVHFGHQKKRWNPKMKPYIFTERNGIHIIDLQQTVQLLEQAHAFVADLTARGGRVLFVGTKKQAQEIIKARGRALPPVLRQPALAGRHPDQLRHHPQPAALPQAAPGPGRARRAGLPAEAGSRRQAQGTGEAAADARRHARHEPAAGRHLHHRPEA